MSTLYARLCTVLCLSFSLSGCAAYFYDWAQEVRVAQCHKLPLGDERVRCEKQAREMDYDRYREVAKPAIPAKAAKAAEPARNISSRTGTP